MEVLKPEDPRRKAGHDGLPLFEFFLFLLDLYKIAFFEDDLLVVLTGVFTDNLFDAATRFCFHVDVLDDEFTTFSV